MTQSLLEQHPAGEWPDADGISELAGLEEAGKGPNLSRLHPKARGLVLGLADALRTGRLLAEDLLTEAERRLRMTRDDGDDPPDEPGPFAP